MADANRKILVVDDETEIRNMLDVFLSVEDFDVVQAADGKAAMRAAISEKPDLILLDLGLPDMDGKDIIAALRQWTNVPIIVLTARTEDEQAVAALNLGADDYITKPFRAEVLLARINANLRQPASAKPNDDILVNGAIRIDLNRHEVTIHDKLVAFTPKEYDILRYFISNKGRVLTHKQILKEVWGPAHTDDTQYLRVYIGQVRDKLDTAAGLGKAIVSEARIGYRMEVLAEPALIAAE